MKKFFSSGAIFLVLAVLAIGVGVWYMTCDSAEQTREDAKTLRSRRIAEAKARTLARKNGKDGKRLPSGDHVKEKAVRVKPDFSAEAEEEAKLSDTMRKIFAELQKALDSSNKKQVFALVRKLQKMDEWPDGIPKAVKLKALDALAWFGSSGFAEAAGFLADADPEVVDATIEKFEEMLSDSFELGDTGVSQILQQLVKVVHDTDALDTFYMEMNNMRDTVKAQTALAIYDSGTPEAIAVLNENVDFIFSDIDKDEITRSDIEQFLAKAEQVYKDDPEKAKDDEEFYGPSKD